MIKNLDILFILIPVFIVIYALIHFNKNVKNKKDLNQSLTTMKRGMLLALFILFVPVVFNIILGLFNNVYNSFKNDNKVNFNSGYLVNNNEIQDKKNNSDEVNETTQFVNIDDDNEINNSNNKNNDLDVQKVNNANLLVMKEKIMKLMKITQIMI